MSSWIYFSIEMNKNLFITFEYDIKFNFYATNYIRDYEKGILAKKKKKSRLLLDFLRSKNYNHSFYPKIRFNNVC